MWYFEMKYGNNCMVGGHFYSREEMLEWFDSMFKYYFLHDECYDLRIWLDNKENENEVN